MKNWLVATFFPLNFCTFAKILMMSHSLFQQFRSATVLVVGDVMIDAYLRGKVTRISPEAPVPVMNVLKREYRLGGAANVALNLQGLGATVLCAVTGEDEKSHVFGDLLRSHGLTADGIMSLPTRKTTVKYRVLGNNAQMMRIDEEDDRPLSEEESARFFERVQQLMEAHPVDAIVFEDYDKGLITKELIQKVVALATSKHIPVTVDPKRRNFKNYDGVTLFKPNLKELTEGVYGESRHLPIEDIEQCMRQFAETYHIDYLLTTLSADGVAVYDRAAGRFATQPAYRREIADVSGAGDTVIAVATLCLVAGVPIVTAAHIANLAGGLVCESAGVVPITAEQLEKEMERVGNF